MCKKIYISIGNNNIGERNAREMSIIALAQGRAKVKNISFETALGLIDFYDKNHQKFEN